ncbi:hypothetical protein LZ31DRAFT_310598 [Colletotrichum somersetense]|nr:hypothetical protein LZ31DRAFT_310598 [Colletotrichum somersetense]
MAQPESWFWATRTDDGTLAHSLISIGPTERRFRMQDWAIRHICNSATYGSGCLACLCLCVYVCVCVCVCECVSV